ncbi:MAG TPA: Dak phosphatase [Coriobacteriia bacterium]|nr:Dak phosphatase [Coriobacteriia bacterium]
MTSNPTDFIPHIAAAVKTLTDRKDEVNKLNVFPVPDGDTGTNISLTMEAVLGELLALPANATDAEVRKAITHGSLMGARGNSGVITSQILRGFCEGLATVEGFDAAGVSAALAKSVEVAFSAVRKPVEGTILTVLRDTANEAKELALCEVSLQEFLLGLRDAAYVSVRNTPELLPVLKENGVVDAGGYGLALLIDGFVASLTGETSVELELGMMRTESLGRVAIEQINDWEGSEYLYCTEFLFRSDDLDVAAAQDFLTTMGDCDLLVGSHPDFKIHVHTDDPGAVLGYMTQRGQIAEVHIHNMRLQSADRLASIETDGGSETSQSGVDVAKTYGFVAVSSGSGMDNILKSLGVDGIVSGGQTMNPSTKDLLDAIAEVKADSVYLFPNNKNIVMAATAAAEFSEKQAKVIPTISVPQAFSALFVVDQEASFDENTEAMLDAIANVHTGEVTLAIKDAKTSKGEPIKDGDTIGLIDDDLEVVGVDVASVTLELLDRLVGDQTDTLTILAGEDLAQDDFDELIEKIEAKHPELEIDAHRGEQPLYPIVLTVE